MRFSLEWISLQFFSWTPFECKKDYFTKWIPSQKHPSFETTFMQNLCAKWRKKSPGDMSALDDFVPFIFVLLCFCYAVKYCASDDDCVSSLSRQQNLIFKYLHVHCSLFIRNASNNTNKIWIRTIYTKHSVNIKHQTTNTDTGGNHEFQFVLVFTSTSLCQFEFT